MEATRALVLVSGDRDSMERGARQVYERLQQELQGFGLQGEVTVIMAGDMGRHKALPLVIVYPEAVLYGPVTPDDVHLLVEEHLVKGQIPARLRASAQDVSGRLAWLSARQGTLPVERRIVLSRVGLIDPDEIEDYIIHDGYEALGKALTSMTTAEVIDQVSKSGLQGRGGAGFPTGTKWRFVAQAKGDPKYVICNADESEPGTFKDRLILEGDPHRIVEALTIAGYAVGANEGYIYVRGEYGLAHERLARAIDQARQMGFLGEDIFGTGFVFDIHVHSGAGAYICGEETALIESIEGKRGEPRARPPYPTTHGLWGKPTLINNVETLANVPPIIHNGGAWYRQFGTRNSPGTKVFSILGNVNVTGVVELSMGITLRELVAIYGKGMKEGAALKLAQTGGSSGSLVPASLQDTPMDFESYTRAGVSLGSGALLACNEDTCVVDLTKVVLKFFRRESCSKCTPCRIGTQRAYEILTSISEGTAELEDLDTLETLAKGMNELSNCGLGQTAAVPIRDLLRHFRTEVEAHITLGACPVGVCPMRERQALAA